MSFVCLVLLSIAVQPAQAQVSGGVEGGINISKLSFTGSDAEGFKGGFKAGAIVGGFVSAPINKMIAIMPEVAWAQKHSKLSGSEGSSRFEQTVKLDVVEIPILVKVAPANAQGFYVVFGPGFAFRTKAKATDTKLNGQSFPSGDEDIKDEIESSDVSLIGGAGFTRRKVGIEARYDHGLRNLNKDKSEDFKVKSRAVTVLVRVFVR
jgi:hypothetical protein